MRLQPDERAPARPARPRSSTRSSRLDRPVVFAYHGYPWLIHRLTYRRTNHDNLHVRGYKEEGTTTTPFDMVMLNDLDRFHLVMDVIDRVPGLAERGRARCARSMQDERLRCRAYTREHGEDRPDVRDWTWPRERLSSILVVNAGSTSLKLSARRRGRASAAARLARARLPRDVVAVGHRVVHGGAALPRAGRCSTTRSTLATRARSSISRRSTTRPRSAAIDEARAAFPDAPARRRLRHGIPRHAARRGVARTPCPRAGATSGASAATAFTASRCSGPPSRCRSRASSSATSAAAAR